MGLFLRGSHVFPLSALLVAWAFVARQDAVSAFTSPASLSVRVKETPKATTMWTSTMDPPTTTTPTVHKSSVSPGLAENSKFDCHESVAFWRDFQSAGFGTVEDNLNEMSRVASRFAAMGPQAQSFFVRHLGRSAYFAVNALLGTTAFQLHERLVRGRDESDDIKVMKRDKAMALDVTTDVGSRLFLEALLSYEQDYQWIRNAVYREPWDMTPANRQASPVNLVTQSSRFVREAIGTLGRRSSGTEDDKKVKYFGTSDRPRKNGKYNFYPEYYQNAFHYQTDGMLDVVVHNAVVHHGTPTCLNRFFAASSLSQVGCRQIQPMYTKPARKHSLLAGKYVLSLGGCVVKSGQVGGFLQTDGKHCRYHFSDGTNRTISSNEI
jgi:hypothetical protein